MKTIQIKQIHSDDFYIEYSHDKQLTIYVFPKEDFKGDFSTFDKKVDNAIKEIFSKPIKDGDETLRKFDVRTIEKC